MLTSSKVQPCVKLGCLPWYMQKEKEDHISEVHAGLLDSPDGTSLPGTVTEIQQLLNSDAQWCVLIMGEWGDNGKSNLKLELPPMPKQTVLPHTFSHF